MNLIGSYIGIWVTRDEIELIADLAREKPRRLVRWDYIRAAERFHERPDQKQPVDFRPRLAA